MVREDTNQGGASSDPPKGGTLVPEKAIKELRIFMCYVPEK